jgi:hypothetical protein
MDNLDDLTGRTWLVSARNEIQSLMLELHDGFDKLDLTDARLLERWQLGVGAAFSLWRAVFLVLPEQTERPITGTATDGLAFLRRVIDTNFVTFADDLRYRDWTGGYYVNGARFRMSEILLTPDTKPFEHLSLRLVWNKYFRLLRTEIRTGFPDHSKAIND